MTLTPARPRVATGLSDLDGLLDGGLRPGRLTVIAARTAMGKSMLALTVARHCALRAGRPALVASLEMANAGLFERTLAAESGVPTRKISSRQLSPEEFELLRETARELDTAALLSFGGDRSTPAVADIERECARMVERHGRLDLVVVDYLGLMEGTLQQRALRDRQGEVAAVVAALDDLADRLQAAVVVVEQLDRDPEFRDDHRPRLSDLWHGDALLRRAQAVILLYRQAYYDPQYGTAVYYEQSPDPTLYPAELFPRHGLPEPAVQRAELHVPHNRHGRTGVVSVGVELARARFFDLR
ncbi:DnaB-like helicase C-terminal domain-containing protein [Streptomyces sp. DT2A-34]|uniref:DnaB-like helicase C-terminal domain-containing protein n=1 Tax=Streptomyces sp. DT2A-34 TaxID=3051182 RepID=UPI00265B90B5|nr:DnaB-like helicase C-terminal domain-containing protein [Streptomyces sp. DT2A-34]MDO0911151.1 DnaB-like helicase C-terminal domain-containing protein [Streptomyces sp. DT2A-34]